jgi:Predicted periplasmic or secreted lipoprotein
MKFSLFLSAALPVALTVGCVYTHRDYAPGTTAVAPTGYYTGPRVYPESTSTRVVTTPGEGDDLSIANSVRNILAKDTAHVYRNVDVSVVKGYVSLRGTVASEQDGRWLYDQIAAIPGVTSVDNQLGLKY